MTRSDCHRITELDGRPALEVYLDALPRLLREDLPSALRKTRVGLSSPDAIEIRDDFLVRPLVGIDAHRDALLVGDEVVPGSRLTLVVHDSAAARSSLEAGLDRISDCRAKLRGGALLQRRGARREPVRSAGSRHGLSFSPVRGARARGVPEWPRVRTGRRAQSIPSVLGCPGRPRGPGVEHACRGGVEHACRGRTRGAGQVQLPLRRRGQADRRRRRLRRGRTPDRGSRAIGRPDRGRAFHPPRSGPRRRGAHAAGAGPRIRERRGCRPHPRAHRRRA